LAFKKGGRAEEKKPKQWTGSYQAKGGGAEGTKTRRGGVELDCVW